jgi:hypothetical protein
MPRDTDRAISQQNVDLIRNLYDLGDFLSITPDQVDDVFRDYLDAEFEVRLIELETTHVWTIKGGRAVPMHAYRDRSEALDAAGRRE